MMQGVASQLQVIMNDYLKGEKVLEKASSEKDRKWFGAIHLLFETMRSDSWTPKHKKPASQLFRHALEKYEALRKNQWKGYEPRAQYFNGYEEKEDWKQKQISFIEHVFDDIDAQAMIDLLDSDITNEEYQRRDWPDGKYFPDDMEGQPVGEKLYQKKR